MLGQLQVPQEEKLRQAAPRAPPGPVFPVSCRSHLFCETVPHRLWRWEGTGGSQSSGGPALAGLFVPPRVPSWCAWGSLSWNTPGAQAPLLRETHCHSCPAHQLPGEVPPPPSSRRGHLPRKSLSSPGHVLCWDWLAAPATPAGSHQTRKALPLHTPRLPFCSGHPSRTGGAAVPLP